VTITLRDGSRVVIRPIEPGDRQTLADGFERLSLESRYRRFFSPIARLSERDLDYLINVDHHDHEALIAQDANTRQGIAVARFVKTAEDVAEAAIVVADDWQGRGLGTQLLEALADRARKEGVTRFEAPVLANNREAIRVLERLGPTQKRLEGTEVALTVELGPAEVGARAHWRELLEQFASGSLEPARTLHELLWPHRRGAPDDERRNVIVVGTDGSPHAYVAVEAAGALAEASGASVAVVAARGFLSGHESEHATAVKEAARGLRDRGLDTDEHVRRGDPALVLTEVAYEQRARLIVVGAGERAKTARRIVGSIAESVALRSPCNVLIVRPRE